MIRRRPIPKTRSYPEASLRYRTVLNGAVRVYPDGREVCTNSKAGWIEYNRRVKLMWERQGRRCCDCGKALALGNATFEHRGREASEQAQLLMLHQGNRSRMPPLPVFPGFLMQWAEMLVRANLQGVFRANGLITGAGFPVADFPVTFEVAGAAAGAEFSFRAKAADDHAGFKCEAHQDFGFTSSISASADRCGALKNRVSARPSRFSSSDDSPGNCVRS